MLCGLEGVAPKSGSSWDIPDLNNYIQTDIAYKAECKGVVESAVGRVHQIVLTDMDDEDVLKKLVLANLVATKTAPETVSSPNARPTGPNQER